jgi:hypothetical protein
MLPRRPPRAGEYFLISWPQTTGHAPRGLMLFDDYLWSEYENALENPAAAINVFLRLKESRYRLVSAYYQIIIAKSGNFLRERAYSPGWRQRVAS